MATLADYKHVETGLFVEWGYKVPRFDSDIIERFSTLNRGVTLDGNYYEPMKNIVSITPVKNQLKGSDQGVTFSFTGHAKADTQGDFSTLIENMMDRGAIKTKGSQVIIRRAFFTPDTNELLELDVNPVIRYIGIVTNWSFKETYDPLSKTGSLVVTLNTTDLKSYMTQLVTGRTTSPEDDAFNDKNFDRVKDLAGTSIQWGAK